MANNPPKRSPPKLTASPDCTDLWRRGASRLVEQGRLMWMLGEGLGAALTRHAQGVAPPDEEALATEIFGWMQRAWTSGPTFQSGQCKAPRSLSQAKNASSASSPVLALLKENLFELRCPVVWLGSREIEGQWASMALAVGVDGLRRVLALAPGSVRERGVAEALATGLATRGLATNGGLLVVTEGSRTLDHALRQVWAGRVQIAHCRTRLRNEVLGHFPEASREKWCTELDAAWSLPPDEAAAVLQHLESRWATDCPGAAERLGRSRAASLIVARLDVSQPLKERLESAGSLRMAFRQSLRWAPRGAALAALTVGVPAWLQRSRRLVGWHSLELLAYTLRKFPEEPINNTAPQA